jgi:hypothetical protein
MGVPNSEVVYTSPIHTEGENTKSIRDMWWQWKNNSLHAFDFSILSLEITLVLSQ